MSANSDFELMNPQSPIKPTISLGENGAEKKTCQSQPAISATSAIKPKEFWISCVAQDEEQEKAALFEENYVHNYMNCMEMDIEAQQVSRILEVHAKQESLMKQLETAFELFLNDEGESSDVDQAHVLNEITSLLTSTSQAGDDGVRAVDHLQNTIDDKAACLSESYKEMSVAEGKGDPSASKFYREPSKKQTRASINPDGKRLLDNLFASIVRGDENLKASSGVAKVSKESDILLPTVATASSSENFKHKSIFDEVLVDDGGYRACKFRDPPDYSNMCAKDKKPRKKRLSQSGGGKEGQPIDGKATKGDVGENKTTDVTLEDLSSKKEGDDDIEPTYCICKNVFYGKMIQCDSEACPIEWFHFGCVGVRRPPKKWFCPGCRGEDMGVEKTNITTVNHEDVD